MKRKKGFTLVELLVVIAILAVLATVSVIGFSSFSKKAKVSNDISLTTQMNNILMANEAIEGTNNTTFDAVNELIEGGLDITKLTPTTNNYNYVFDLTSNRMFLLNEKNEVVSPTNYKITPNLIDRFAFVGKEDEMSKFIGYSYYLKNNFDVKNLNISTGLDVGNNIMNTITYTPTRKQNITLNTNGGKLIVNDDKDGKQFFYGKIDNAEISTGFNCFYSYGTIEKLNLKKGKVIAEKGSLTKLSYALGNTIIDKKDGSVVIKNPDVTISETANVELSSNDDLGLNLFAGGNGTDKNPFLINNSKQLENISLFSNDYYNYKVIADEIDCSVLSSFDLYGLFDGNNATFKNITKYFIRYAGYNLSTTPTIIKNLKAVLNTPNSLIFTIDSKEVTFENVNISGYMEGNWNMGAFVNYGTANARNGGSNYTLNFIKCSCNATIISKQNQSAAILVGHCYPGNGNEATINVDSDTEEGIKSATIYTAPNNKNEATGYKYYIIGPAKVYLNNNLVTDQKYPANIILKNDIIKENNKYNVTIVPSSTKVIYQLTAQLSAIDANGNEIKDLSGITFTLGGKVSIDNVAGKDKVSIIDEITDVEIKNEKTESGIPTYKIENNKLIVFTNSKDNYVKGSITLSVSQYREDGLLLANSNIMMLEKKTTTSTWQII